MTSHAIVIPKSARAIPHEYHTAAYRLFHYPRSCSVQQMFTLDPERIKKWGVATSGNAKFDREVSTSWVEVMMTAVDMVDLIKKGASIQFANHAVAKATYLDLVEHLQRWLNDVSSDPSIMEAPVEELREFDHLAALIWPYARHLMVKDDEASGYGQYMSALLSGRASLTLSNRFRKADLLEPRANAMRVYKPYSDRIAEWIHQRNQSFQG